jgi:hypothetical protein
VVGYGVTRIRTSIDLMKLFDSKARILQDYRWLENRVTRLVPLEIILRFDGRGIDNVGSPNDDSGTSLNLLKRLEAVSLVHRTVVHQFGAGGEDKIAPPMSALTFLPNLPRPGRGLSVVTRRSATNSILENCYASLKSTGYLRQDSAQNQELWRVSVRVAAFRGVDYGRFTDQLRKTVDPIIERINNAYWPGQSPQLSAVYTGVVPIVYKAQRSLLDSLVESIFWSFVTITPVVMVVSRGFAPGLVAMLPNVLPVLVVFGGMGWMGLSVDIGSMMSASIALGVAVDDTIHYLTWFRDELTRTHDRRQSILAAYRRCAAPTLQATFINGLGLSVFAFSNFAPTKQFGYLMLSILVAGVVAELILLPALLAGPLGKVFRPGPRRPTYVLNASFPSNTPCRGPVPIVLQPHLAKAKGAKMFQDTVRDG